MDRFQVHIRQFQSRLDRLPMWKIYALLTALYMFCRLLTLPFVEKSGDAIYKWGILRRFLTDGVWYPLYPDHHQGRWAIMMPELLVAKVFGAESIWVYYLFPLLTGLAAGLLTYAVTTRLSNRGAGLAAFVLFLFLPQTVRESVQFLPMLPSAVFLLAATWFMLRYLDNRKLREVFGCGCMVFLAYGCKFTALYWGGAFGLFLLFCDPAVAAAKRRWRLYPSPATWLLAATILGGWVLETLLLNYFFDVQYGRIQIILGAHLANREGPQYLNLLEYLLSFFRPLDMSGKYMDTFPKIFLTIGALIAAAAWLRKPRTPQQMTAWVFAGAYLAHCYVVYKVFPFLHPEKPHSRYFLVLYLFAAILVCAGWSDIGRIVWQRLRRPWNHAVPAALILAFSVLVLIYCGNVMQDDGTPLTIFHAEAVMKEAKARQLPVLLELQRAKEPGQPLDGADRRNFILWGTLYGPAAEIHTLPTRELQWFRAGDEYYLPIFHATQLRTAEPVEAVIIQENDCRLAPITLEPVR